MYIQTSTSDSESVANDWHAVGEIPVNIDCDPEENCCIHDTPMICV